MLSSGSPASVAALLLAVALAVPALASAADAPLTPVGRWTTVDDATGRPRSVVRIWEEDGKLTGKVESFIPQPGDDPDPTCEKCEGERKDQPIVGMVILWGLAKDGSQWRGGRILDPENGKTYRCIIEPIAGGKKLMVRGFVGFALVGRSQTWLRAAD